MERKAKERGGRVEGTKEHRRGKRWREDMVSAVFLKSKRCDTAGNRCDIGIGSEVDGRPEKESGRVE